MGIIGTYRRIVPNSYAHSAVMGAASGGIGALAWRPLVEIGSSLARPAVALANGGRLPKDYDAAVEELKRDRALKLMMAAVLALAGASTTLMADYRGNEEGGGWGKWDAPRLFEYGTVPFDSSSDFYKVGSADAEHYVMAKRAMVDDFLADPGGLMDVKYSDIANVNEINRLFDRDPYLSDMDYARNSAQAIVNSAAISNGTMYPTYGNIYDSAVDKFDNRLTLGGVANVAVRTAVANGLSNLFVGALGTVMDLPENMRNNLVSAGTWAGALGAIFK